MSCWKPGKKVNGGPRTPELCTETEYPFVCNWLDERCVRGSDGGGCSHRRKKRCERRRRVFFGTIEAADALFSEPRENYWAIHFCDINEVALLPWYLDLNIGFWSCMEMG